MLQNNNASVFAEAISSGLISEYDIASITKLNGDFFKDYIDSLIVLVKHESISIHDLERIASNQPYALREILKYASTAIHYIDHHNISIYDIASIAPNADVCNLTDFLEHPSLFDTLYSQPISSEAQRPISTLYHSMYHLTEYPYDVKISDIVKISLASQSSLDQIEKDPLSFCSFIHFLNTHVQVDISKDSYLTHHPAFQAVFPGVKDAYTNHHITPKQSCLMMHSTSLDMRSVLNTITMLPKSKRCNIADCKQLAMHRPAVFLAVHNNLSYAIEALRPSKFYLHDFMSSQFDTESIISHINSHDVIEYMSLTKQAKPEQGL